MFGYKVNKVKAMNITGRQAFNYVKTVGCTLHGSNISYEDMQEIRDKCNVGVYFWHTDNMYDFNQSNNII